MSNMIPFVVVETPDSFELIVTDHGATVNAISKAGLILETVMTQCLETAGNAMASMAGLTLEEFDRVSRVTITDTWLKFKVGK